MESGEVDPTGGGDTAFEVGENFEEKCKYGLLGLDIVHDGERFDDS